MTLLLCQCIHRRWLSPEELAGLGASLQAGERAARLVPDLCLLAERRDAALAEIASTEDLTIVACSPRAVRGLFAWAGLPLPAAVRILDVRESSVAEILAACDLRSEERKPPPPPSPAPEAWVPWFPVVETERCLRCGQCIEFCLFDVYDRADDGSPLVARPRNCKDNCPACARLCPANAIVFPKAGDPEVSGQREAAPPKQNRTSMREILRKGAAEALRERRREQQGKSMVRDDVRRALEDRARCQKNREDEA